MTSYRWNGRHGRGYMQTVRAAKRAEAEQRNAATVPEQRAKFRRRLARLDKAAAR